MRDDRVHVLGNSPYEHERAAIDFLVAALPGSDPYRLWALFDILDPNNGALYEVDALILGYRAIYLVEIKSHPGAIRGDDVDWAWNPYDDSERTIWLRNPLATTNHKCKVLAGQLRNILRDKAVVPRVEPLVFLSAESDKLVLQLTERGRVGVVTRDNVAHAITRHQYSGASTNLSPRIDTPAAQAVEAALGKLGVRARKGRMRAGQYELGALVDTGPSIQDREAVHLTLGEKRSAIARTYLVSQQVTDERRRKLHAAAKREFSLLLDVGSHPNIVAPIELVADAELGPTLLLEDYRQSRPLSQQLRKEEVGPSQTGSEPLQTLSFDERGSILLQVARAVAFCHRRKVRHGALCPDAVLIERRAHADPLVRLRNFVLGASDDISAPVTTQLLASNWQLYQAPECFRGAEPSEAGDVFSVGALAYHVFVGRPAAPTVVELFSLLAKTSFLDLTAATDSVSDDLAALVMEATALSPVQRALTAEEFANRLEELLTKPSLAAQIEASLPEQDPLSARKDDVILGRYHVEGVRGEGATARVLQVRDAETNRQLALKVALDSAHDSRLEVEAELLRELDHTRIVRLDRSFVAAGRRCLTMTLAGESTLADALRERGALSLDFAHRYGDELLDALRYLEVDVQKLHRDIKPANLGVGAVGKQAHHLTLFDFSLASAPLDAMEVGTAAYRDPHLVERGRWDFAADRYAAAVTLYEMLTGVRPQIADVTQPVRIEADRFDPAVKDGLAHFFGVAFAADVDSRYPSAEDMRRRWTAAFDERVSRHLASARSAGASPLATAAAEPPLTYSDAELLALALETPVEQLRLSPQAKSALSRAGLFRAADVLALPNNRLSAIRGVGRRVSEEILSFRERWAGARGTEQASPESFLTDFAGDALPISSDELSLTPSAVRSLQDAGLGDTRSLAFAPRTQVELLLERARQAPGPIRQALAQLSRHAHGEGQTLAGLVEDFLGGKTKAAQHVRSWWGLAQPFLGRLDVAPSEAAAELGGGAPALHVKLGQLCEKWQDHPRRDALEARVEEAARSVERVAPLAQLAETLLANFGEADRSNSEARAQAAALVRIVAELQREDDSGLRLVRAPGDGNYWLTDAEDTLDLLRALGRRADLLAMRVPLASPAAALRELRAALPKVGMSAAEGAPPRLVGLADVRLLQLACAWSEHAALSARLELYPRAMSAARALELCLASLDADPTLDEVRRRVTGRFPAVLLPEGDALDALLENQGFEWDEQQQCYLRSSPDGLSNPNTQLVHTITANTSSGSVAEPIAGAEEHSLESPSAPLTDGAGIAPADVTPLELKDERLRSLRGATSARRVDGFERSLRSVLERGGLRVITVNAGALKEAELTLARRLKTHVVQLDRDLATAMRAREPAQTEIMYEIDAAGPDGPEWADLTEVAMAAADQIASELFQDRRVLLLSRPGLCARYRLSSFLERLVTYAEGDQRPSVFLLVPTVGAANGLPRIEDVLAVPRVAPHQVLRMHKQDLSAQGAA